MHRLKILLLIGILAGCNSNKKQPTDSVQPEKQKTQSAKKLTGNQIVSKLDSLEFFNLTEKSELERAKNEMIKSKNELNYFSGTLRGETMDFTDNRFFSVDCEELFEVGGLTEYLKKVKPTFEKLGLKLEYENEISEQTKDYWKHTIQINGVRYNAFDTEFSEADWEIAYVNFIEILNDQLNKQNNNNQFYPIKCGNDGEFVLLTDNQFELVKENYPNDFEHPKTLLDWKLKIGL